MCIHNRNTFANLENTRNRPLITPPSTGRLGPRIARGALDKGADVSLATPVGDRILVFLIESSRSVFLHHQSRDEESLLPPAFFPSPEANNVPSAPTVDGSSQERTSCCDVSPRGSAFLLSGFYTVSRGFGISFLSKGWVFNG